MKDGSGDDLLAPADRWQEFDAYRLAEDIPNAIRCFDALSDDWYEWLRHSQPFDPDLPGIVSSFMPKSGGTFLFNRLVSNCGYVVYHWGFAHPRAAHEVYAVPRALRNYLRGGCTSHTHFLPSPHNVDALEAAGVRRVWVHVRHPCEVVQSAYYHYAGLGQGEGDVARRRVEDNAQEASTLGIEADAGDPHKLNVFFREQLGWVVDWLCAWLAHAEQTPGFVHFTSHRELDDPVRLLRGVFEVFGVPLPVDALPEHLPEDRLRIGHANDWRDQLEPETIEAATALLEARLAPHPRARELCGLER